MKKAYIQPEIDLFSLRSAEDILANSVNEGTMGDSNASGTDSSDHNDSWGWN